MAENVLLGFVDKEIIPSDILDWTTNKLGGIPVWKDDRISNLRLKCKLCGRLSALVTQINCPLGNSNYHRVFFIFCCVNASCWNKSESWWAVRCQIKEENEAPFVKVPYTINEWLPDADVWCDGSNSVDKGIGDICDDLESISMKTNLKEHQEKEVATTREEVLDDVDFSEVIPEQIVQKNMAFPWIRDVQSETLEMDFLPIFQPYYICVLEEPKYSDSPSDHVQELLNQYQTNSGNPFYSSSAENKAEQEAYEKSEVRHGDKTFYKFYKRVKRCPTQIIRYSWSGFPLHMSPNDENLHCEYCFSKKVYEFQLMPALVPLLRLLDIPDSGSVSAEFGTVLIYSCANSCWKQDDVVKYESVIVQADPYENIFQNLTLLKGKSQ